MIGLGDAGDTAPTEEGARSQECAFKPSAAAPGTAQVPGRCQGCFVAPVFRHIPHGSSLCLHSSEMNALTSDHPPAPVNTGKPDVICELALAPRAPHTEP